MPSSKPANSGREHERRVDTAQPEREPGRVVGAHGVFGAERTHELEPLLAHVDTNDAVAERVRDLHARSGRARRPRR